MNAAVVLLVSVSVGQPEPVNSGTDGCCTDRRDEVWLLQLVSAWPIMIPGSIQRVGCWRRQNNFIIN
jgi:hypothetical protein